MSSISPVGAIVAARNIAPVEKTPTFRGKSVSVSGESFASVKRRFASAAPNPKATVSNRASRSMRSDESPHSMMPSRNRRRTETTRPRDDLRELGQQAGNGKRLLLVCRLEADVADDEEDDEESSPEVDEEVSERKRPREPPRLHRVVEHDRYDEETGRQCPSPLA